MLERILWYLGIAFVGMLFYFKEIAHSFLPMLTTDELLSLLILLLLGQSIAAEIHHSSFRRKTLADRDALLVNLREERDAWRTQAQTTTAHLFKYFPPSTQAFNEQFYDYLVKKLDGAKNAIYLVGWGFSSAEYATSKGQRVIRDYYEATKRALRKDVTMVRVQTRNNISQEWATMLKELINEFPTKFNLYYLPIKDIEIVTFAVFDPDLENECVVEIMMSSNHLWGRAGERPASSDFTSFFITGNTKLAESFQKLIVDKIHSHEAVHISNSTMIDDVLVGSQPDPASPRERRRAKK